MPELSACERKELEALRAYVIADDAANRALASDRYADSVTTQRLIEVRKNARARLMEWFVLSGA